MRFDLADSGEDLGYQAVSLLNLPMFMQAVRSKYGLWPRCRGLLRWTFLIRCVNNGLEGLPADAL